MCFSKVFQNVRSEGLSHLDRQSVVEYVNEEEFVFSVHCIGKNSGIDTRGGNAEAGGKQVGLQ